MKLNINNKTYETGSPPEGVLIDILREELRLTGTKRGCDIGVCGTCTVLINGVAKRSCVVKLSSLNESDEILTIEGLSKDGELHPIQRAFIAAGAVQCGFCTPGMILTAKALLDKNPNPSRQDIKKSFLTNLCRCTGYKQIFDAVELAAKNLATKPETTSL